MAVARLVLIALFAFAALPAAAQNESIVVRGGRMEQPSGWHEAGTEHVVVVSDGSRSELIRIAHNLERLHFLLSVLLDRVDHPDVAVKLRVTLVGNAAEFDAMELRNLRSRQGPYSAAFQLPRYYDPREDGAVLAISRLDRRALLQPGVSISSLDPMQLQQAPTLPPDMQMAPEAGGFDPFSLVQGTQTTRFGQADPSAPAVNAITVPLPAENRIYAAFAQHFLLTYYPLAFPRWYVDGFGEIFATIRVRGDGTIEFGRAPDGYSRVEDFYIDYPIQRVLDGRYLAEGSRTRWTPFHAWALTHFLFFSEERRSQLREYLNAIARGEPYQQAMAAFGDISRLQSDLRTYDNRRMPYEVMTFPPERAAEPIVRQLTRGQAAFVRGRLELGSRVELPPPAPPGADLAAAARAARLREEGRALRTRWLAGLRRDAGRYAGQAEAQLLLAEAECRSGNSAECLAAAQRASALAPGDSSALAWMGMAMVQQAIDGPAGERAARLRAARAAIVRANRANTEAPLPLLAYYRSFADAGEAAPDVAVEGLMKAVDLVPTAPGPRLMLSEELIRRGLNDRARRILMPVAQGAWPSPEQARARALLATIPAD